jgi:hypothetical protein
MTAVTSERHVGVDDERTNDLFSSITVTVLDSIHSPVFYLKLDVSETGFCLYLDVEPTLCGPTDRVTLFPDPGRLYLQ